MNRLNKTTGPLVPNDTATLVLLGRNAAALTRYAKALLNLQRLMRICSRGQRRDEVPSQATDPGMARKLRCPRHCIDHINLAVFSMHTSASNNKPEYPRDQLLQADIDTPALLLDLTALENNIARMTRFARANQIALRPHAKTHKSAEIAKLQLQAGAIGICCAKLSEAERLADAGISGLLITSSIVGRQKLARLARLYEQLPGLMVVADNPDVVAAIGSNLPRLSRELPILIDIDVGHHRSGVVGVEAACNLAQTIERTAGLRFAGIQGYAGHVQHIRSYAKRYQEAEASAGHLRSIVEALQRQGIACPIVTGGGTGTHDIDGHFGIYSDLQVGSYVFMDVEYLDIECSPSASGRFQSSLFVLSHVISASQPDHVTIDAGSKSLSFDGPMPAVVAPGGTRLKYELYGDEFGKIGPLSRSTPLRLGDKVLLLTPHCDPTVNLHDRYVCVRNSKVVGEWEIQARGCAT